MSQRENSHDMVKRGYAVNERKHLRFMAQVEGRRHLDDRILISEAKKDDDKD